MWFKMYSGSIWLHFGARFLANQLKYAQKIEILTSHLFSMFPSSPSLFVRPVHSQSTSCAVIVARALPKSRWPWGLGSLRDDRDWLINYSSLVRSGPISLKNQFRCRKKWKTRWRMASNMHFASIWLYSFIRKPENESELFKVTAPMWFEKPSPWPPTSLKN